MFAAAPSIDPMGLLQWLGLTSTTANQTGVLSPYSGSHLGAVTLQHLFDLGVESLPLDRAQAMAIPSVARGRNIITQAIGRVSWEARTGTARTTDQPAVLAQPEGAARARTLTYSWTADSLLFYGRAWWIVLDRAYNGRPSRVQWVPETAVSWDDAWFYAYGRPVAFADVLRIDGPHEGVLTYGQDVLKAARAIGRAYGRTAANPTPAIELHQTQGDKLNEEEIDRLIARWIAARTSPNGAVGFTNAALEVRTHGLPAEQLLIQGRKSVTLEVAQLLNLPAWALDGEVGGSSITYSNSPSRSRELLDYTLAGYFDAIAGRLSMDDILPRGTWAHPLTEQLTTPDFADRMAGYKAAQDAGIYTREQCIALETGTPLEGNPA